MYTAPRQKHFNQAVIDVMWQVTALVLSFEALHAHGLGDTLQCMTSTSTACINLTSTLCSAQPFRLLRPRFTLPPLPTSLVVALKHSCKAAVSARLCAKCSHAT